MKQEKHTDKDIAQVLKNAGRVDYNVKTIGSRWKRLRIALAAAKDRELDAGFADWHTVDVSAVRYSLTMRLLRPLGWKLAASSRRCRSNRLRNEAEDRRNALGGRWKEA